MDSVKIGNFIRECRKNKNMTQQQLADKLFVEAKTVSKWETGNGMPDTSIMKNLCEELCISLNELFVGEHINEESKDKEIEKLILETFEKEKKMNKRNLVSEIVLGSILILLAVMAILIAGLADMETYLRVIIISISVLSMIGGIIGLVILDVNIGYFECEECHERFVPTLKEYVFSIHSLKKRKLTCPKCGKTTWCSKRLTKEK